MSESNKLDLWRRVFSFVSAGCQGGVEHEWAYRGLQVFPIVKAQILMKASNVLHAERGTIQASTARPAATPKTIAGFTRLKHLFSRALQQGKSPLEMPESLQPLKIDTDQRILFDGDSPDLKLAWPALPMAALRTEVLCLGYATNHKKIGDQYYQLCMEPLRLALARANVSSILLINGIRDGDKGTVDACASGVMGLEAEFRRARALTKQLPPADLSAMSGFNEWWAELEAIVGDTPFVSKEHVAEIVRETAGIGAWLYSNLKESDVKAILLSSYYGLIGHGCSAAAGALGIEVGDVQHGVAGREHHAYSWPNAGRFGFNTLPGHFFCWSEKEAREMRELSPDWRPGTHVIGNVWALLDDVLAEPGPVEPIRSRARDRMKSAMDIEAFEFHAAKMRNGGTANILLALHPEERLPWLAELKRLAPAEWKFWIRLHPGDFKNDLSKTAPWAEFEDESTEVVLPTKAPLNLVLREIDLVLTKFSSVSLDALAYGVPTVAYSDSARLFNGEHDESKLLICQPDAASIRDAIAQRFAARDGGKLDRQSITDFGSLGTAIRDDFVNALEV